MPAPQEVSVIMSTYDSPAWLERVLTGYAAQDVDGFEIVLADDGSGPETRVVVQAMGRHFQEACSTSGTRTGAFRSRRS